jgi:hypothetical protein
MAIAWTSLGFEQQPRNLTNPGFGAEAIRTDKVAVREHGEVEHFWGDNEVNGSLGRHREGSASAFILDDDSNTRLGRLISTRLVGQLEIDLLDKATIPEIDEVDITDDRIYNLVISTYDKDDLKVKVFDDSLYVSKDLDQLVSANINFTGDLEVKDVSSSEQVGEPLLGLDPDKDKPIKFDQVRDEVNTAFYWNTFDKSEALNTGHFGLNGTELNIDISANVIRANNVYGAVWG